MVCEKHNSGSGVGRAQFCQWFLKGTILAVVWEAHNSGSGVGRAQFWQWCGKDEFKKQMIAQSKIGRR